MATTKIVNLYKCPYGIYIGRTEQFRNGYFGNPFVLEKGDDIVENMAKYKEYFDRRILLDPIFKQKIHNLRGMVLGCTCKPNLCHGDIIVNYLNNLTDGGEISSL